MIKACHLDDRVVNAALSVKQKSSHLELRFRDINDIDPCLIDANTWVVKVRGHKLKLYPIINGNVNVKGETYKVKRKGNLWKVSHISWSAWGEGLLDADDL